MVQPLVPPQTPSIEEPQQPVPIMTESMEDPSLIAAASLPIAESPMPPDMSVPLEPSVSDLGSIMPSVDESDMISGTGEAPSLTTEMPQIPPADVSQVLGPTIEDQHLPPAPVDTALPPAHPDLPQMENMGYDQVCFWITREKF